MNEKTVCCILAIFLIICLFSIMVAGCKSTAANSTDIKSVERTGYIAVGELKQLHSQLENDNQEAIDELERITGTAGDLGTTIRELISFSQRILNERDSLANQVQELIQSADMGDSGAGDNDAQLHY